MLPHGLEHLVRSRALEATDGAARGAHMRAAKAARSQERVEGAVQSLQLPGIRTPQALADAWAGAYGAGGLRIDARDTTFGAKGHKLQINQKVRAADGAHAGVAQMSMWRNPGGDLHASWDWIELEPGLRRTGFGRAYMDDGIDLLKAQGARTLSLTAGLKDGGVVWARMPGMRFAARRPEGPVAQILANAILHGRISAVDGWRIARSNPSTPGEILAHGELGVRALRGSGWNGVIDIS